MSILPVRDLGSTGVVTDKSAYNIPLNGFSRGFNVRFDEGKVTDLLFFSEKFRAVAMPMSPKL